MLVHQLLPMNIRVCSESSTMDIVGNSVGIIDNFEEIGFFTTERSCLWRRYQLSADLGFLW